MLMGNANHGTTPPSSQQHSESAFEIAGIKAHVKAGLPKREFVQIEFEDHKKGPRKDITDAHFPYNSQKNRYTNILPCDDTRVKLKSVEGVDGSDYINANFIEGEHGVSRAYIATQGPLMQTRQDFWRMVWENNCYVIVMLGKEEENRRIKVDRYWPEAGEETLVLPPIKIQNLSKTFDTIGSVNIRKLQVTNDLFPKEKRIVMHYQYEGWQDHGVPKTAAPIRHLVKMIEEDRKKVEKTPSPMIVHCSAGVGRTGTFCTVHMAMQRLHNAVNQRKLMFGSSTTISTDPSSHSTQPSPRASTNNNNNNNNNNSNTTNGPVADKLQFDLYSTVKKLRVQRPGMVQQMEQYLFCYEAIAEEAEELGLIPPETASEISSSTVLHPPPSPPPQSPRSFSSPNISAITTSSQLSQQQFSNHAPLPSSSSFNGSAPPPNSNSASTSSYTSSTGYSGHYSGGYPGNGGYNSRNNPLGQSSAHLPPPGSNPLLMSSATILPPSYGHSSHYSPSLHLHLGSSNSSTHSHSHNPLAQSTASLGSSSSSLSSSGAFSVPLAAVSPSSD